MRKLLKDTAGYVLLNYLATAVTTVRGILLIALLTPFNLGIYKLIFTYTSYFRYYNLGLNALAFYRAPLKRLEYSYSVLLRNINTTLAIAFGLIFTAIFSMFWWGTLAEQGLLDLIFWIFVILFFTQLGETFLTISKIYRRFPLVSAYNILFASLSLALMVLLGYYFELRGVVLGLALATVISCVFVMCKLPKQPLSLLGNFRFKVRTLFKHSILTIIPGMLTVLFSTVEIWIIAYKYGAVETGFYAVVSTVVSLILMLNTDGMVFIYSKKSADLKNDKKMVWRLSAVAFVIVTVVCAACALILQWVMALFFPKYVAAADIFMICFWGIPFLVFRNVILYYIANKKLELVSYVLFFLLALKTGVLALITDKHGFYTSLAALNAVYGISLLILLYFKNVQPKTESETDFK
jgi:O-antigen/teichoic acid export membrane protein